MTTNLTNLGRQNGFSKVSCFESVNELSKNSNLRQGSWVATRCDASDQFLWKRNLAKMYLKEHSKKLSTHRAANDFQKFSLNFSSYCEYQFELYVFLHLIYPSIVYLASKTIAWNASVDFGTIICRVRRGISSYNFSKVGSPNGNTCTSTGKEN